MLSSIDFARGSQLQAKCIAGLGEKNQQNHNIAGERKPESQCFAIELLNYLFNKK